MRFLGRAAAVAFLAGVIVNGAACGSSSNRPVVVDDPDADAATLSDTDADVPDAAVDVVDAGNDVIVTGPSYCSKLSPQPKFCDDFDDGDLKNNWDAFLTEGGSLIDLDNTTFTSAPFSYVAATDTLASGVAGNASLRKTILGTVSHATLSFSANFSATTITEGQMGILTLDLSSNHFLRVYLRDTDPTAPAAILEEQVNGTVVRHLLKALPTPGVWQRVVLDADLVAGKVTLSFDSVKALDAEPIVAQVGTEATIRLGAVYVTGPSEAFQANFDDVVLDF